MIIKYIAKCFVIIFSLFMVAYVINLTHLIFDPADRMQASSFWPVYHVTIILIFCYALWINWMYNVTLESAWKTEWLSKTYIRTVLYVLLASVPIIVVHGLFVHAGVILTWRSGVDLDLHIIKSNYWRKDFVYFAIPLFATQALFYFFPALRFFRGKSRKVDLSAIDDLQFWKLSHKPDVLLKHLRQVISTEVIFDGIKIRVFDIVFIVFENGFYFAILTNGEKCLIQFSKDSLAQWPLGKWFVKIKDKVHINMLYVKYPVKNIKELRLENETNAALFRDGRLSREELLFTGRRLEKNVKDFLNNINQLGEEGWEEYIASK
ncbi:hypothetical protein FAZ15_22145 [Sphingobacterium olei]|uniref:Uncharacterized protein n=1 Tax=Sphingobacterium olei TaxID=2571155 RepID=A0A4U0N7Q1_9SPHI|nr:hypothetical protein [Sphingobacterium olei]TJZ49861.1 hypothetical protein FAZ15_22145 [Sphingobacterium olei]